MRVMISEFLVMAGFIAFTTLRTVTLVLRPKADRGRGISAGVQLVKAGCWIAVPETKGSVPSMVHT